MKTLSVTDLLDCVAATIKQDVVGEVEGAARYAALMSANAANIPKREYQLWPELRAAELRQLVELYGEEVVRQSGADDDARHAAMERRLADDIRDGVLDGACAAGLRVLLRERAKGRLAISNPRYLDRALNSNSFD